MKSNIENLKIGDLVYFERTDLFSDKYMTYNAKDGYLCLSKGSVTPYYVEGVRIPLFCVIGIDERNVFLKTGYEKGCRISKEELCGYGLRIVK